MAKLSANSGGPDQTSRSDTRRLILVSTVCQLPFKGFPVYSGLRYYLQESPKSERAKLYCLALME